MPEIRSFTADASEVGWGEPVALRWRVVGADTFWLDRIGRVGESGAVLRPTAATDYVLIARGLGGDVQSAPLHVSVTSSLALAVGADDTGGSELLVRLRNADGTPQAQDVPVTLSPPGGEALQLGCAAGQPVCSLRVASPPQDGDYTAAALLAGRSLQARASASQARIGRAANLRAAAPAALVEVGWDPVESAAGYRVQLVDLEANESVGEAVTVTEAAASLPLGTLPLQRAGIAVEAWSALEPGDAPLAVSRATGFVSAGASGGTGDRWQIFAPPDFTSDSLDARFAYLDAGERLAVIAVNAGGADGAEARFTVSGTAEPEPPPAAAASSSALRLERPPDLHEAMRAHQDAVLRVAVAQGLWAWPAPAAAPDSFCVVRGLDFGNRVRKRVVRMLQTEHAVFFVDADDLAHYPAGFFDTLGVLFESQAYPADRLAFGAESDVDGNGKLYVLLTHELGAHLNGGWLLGYFGSDDLLRPRDGSSDCGGTGSNGADLLYLNDVANAQANGFSAADAAASVFPATLAHELQHLINLNQRCLLRRCSGPEDTWINEGLSKVAEDLAGFGWNGGQGRWEGAQYLLRSGGTLRGYDGRSLTRWEGDPIGNYQGAHSFVRYFADRRGPLFPSSLVQGPGGVIGMESVLGEPLPRAIADWATALLFSNEAASPDPRFDYLGSGWAPLHARLRHLDWQGLGAQGATVSLREDGISVLVTGESSGGPAALTVYSSAAVKPHVVVARFSGDLPR